VSSWTGETASTLARRAIAAASGPSASLSPSTVASSGAIASTPHASRGGHAHPLPALTPARRALGAPASAPFAAHPPAFAVPFRTTHIGDSSFPGGSSPSAAHSRTAPPLPTAPAPPGGPAGFGAAAGGGGGFGGGSAALMVALGALGGCILLRRHRCPLVVWRPAAFVSLQEQPG
jgi:hypothetical protein